MPLQIHGLCDSIFSVVHGNIREMAVTECSKITFNTISINCKRQQLVGLMTIYHHMGLLKRGFFRPKEQPSLNISGTLSINDLLQVIIRMVGLLQMRIQIKKAYQLDMFWQSHFLILFSLATCDLDLFGLFAYQLVKKMIVGQSLVRLTNGFKPQLNWL